MMCQQIIFLEELTTKILSDKLNNIFYKQINNNYGQTVKSLTKIIYVFISFNFFYK